MSSRLPTILLIALLALAVVPAADAATLGVRPLKRGKRGGDVKLLQQLLTRQGFRAGGVDGVFGKKTGRAVRRMQRRRHLAVDGVVGPQTVRGLAVVWRRHTATYYGPGLWGNHLACGGKLRHRTVGVAHRSLPCGARVPVYHDGRLAYFRVVDRGPFTSGVSLDLTKAAARKLRMSTTSAVRAGS
jgi:rare lipoprotein A (peptidoglycan hydrolase)